MNKSEIDNTTLTAAMVCYENEITHRPELGQSFEVFVEYEAGKEFSTWIGINDFVGWLAENGEVDHFELIDSDNTEGFAEVHHIGGDYCQQREDWQDETKVITYTFKQILSEFVDSEFVADYLNAK